MYCTNCGTKNDDRAGRCFSCGNVLPVLEAPLSAPAAAVPTYMVPAILATVCSLLLCCCLSPLGIVAIVFASQVSGRLAAGDVTGALAASRKAKIWTWATFGASLAGIVFLILAVVIRVATGR